MSSANIAYFGYGSLVNLGSLQTPYISAHRVTLKGWNRIWMARPKEQGGFAQLDNLAFLSVVSAPEGQIDGMLITDHASSLTSLDERESLYTRVDIDQADLHHHDENLELEHQFLYVADKYPAPDETKIPRSYLDVVMQGYHHHFGIQGLQSFFDTTLNFDLSILEDRDNPVYPRATQLTNAEKALFNKFRPVK